MSQRNQLMIIPNKDGEQKGLWSRQLGSCQAISTPDLVTPKILTPGRRILAILARSWSSQLHSENTTGMKWNEPIWINQYCTLMSTMTMPRLIETEDSIAKEIPKTLLTFLGVECLSHCCIVLHRTLASSVLLHIQQQPLDLQDHEVPGTAGSTAV